MPPIQPIIQFDKTIINNIRYNKYNRNIKQYINMEWMALKIFILYH